MLYAYGSVNAVTRLVGCNVLTPNCEEHVVRPFSLLIRIAY